MWLKKFLIAKTKNKNVPMIGKTPLYILASLFMVAFFVIPSIILAQVPWKGPTGNPPDGNPPGFLLNTSEEQAGDLSFTGTVTINNLQITNCLILGSEDCISSWSDIPGSGGSAFWAIDGSDIIYNTNGLYDPNSKPDEPHVSIGSGAIPVTALSNKANKVTVRSHNINSLGWANLTAANDKGYVSLTKTGTSRTDTAGLNIPGGSGMIYNESGEPTKSPLVFVQSSTQANGATTAEEVMRISEDGNVGIGGTAPSAKLSVAGYDNTAILAIGKSGLLGMTLSSGGKAIQGLAMGESWSGWFSGGSKGVYVDKLCLGTQADCKTSWDAIGGSDNLGNHIATQNLDMSDYEIRVKDKNGNYYVLNERELSNFSTGMSVRPDINPANGEVLFSVQSTGNADRLVVEHNGQTYIEYNDFAVYNNDTKTNPAFYVDTSAGSVDVAGGVDTGIDTTKVALRVNGDQAIYYDQVQKEFSWGFDGKSNYFADRVHVGSQDNANYKFYVSADSVAGGGSTSAGGFFVGNSNLSPTVAVSGQNFGAGGQSRTGVYGNAGGGSVQNVGVSGVAGRFSDSGAELNIGVHGIASGYDPVTDTNDWAGYFDDGGIFVKDRLCLNSETNCITDWSWIESGSDIYKISGKVAIGYTPLDNERLSVITTEEITAISGKNDTDGTSNDTVIGVRGVSVKTNSNATMRVGVSGWAQGGDKNYGVYGTANYSSDGNENWAGYFTGGQGVYASDLTVQGDTHINGDLITTENKHGTGVIIDCDVSGGICKCPEGQFVAGVQHYGGSQTDDIKILCYDL